MVLNFASLGLITGIPGAIINPFSYMAVPWFRRHFSSRFLYIIGNKIDGILLVPVFLVGCIGGKKHGLYKNIWVMGIAMMLWETIFMIFYGVRRITRRKCTTKQWTTANGKTATEPRA